MAQYYGTKHNHLIFFQKGVLEAYFDMYGSA